jgi:flavin-dependent dehydrogenase
MQLDIAVIGGGPGGSSTAISAARAGLRVVLFEKGPYGRDKVCGDGLTPRAIGALNELNIDHSVAHRIDGLRMIAGKKQRELLWPATDRFPITERCGLDKNLTITYLTWRLNLALMFVSMLKHCPSLRMV